MRPRSLFGSRGRAARRFAGAALLTLVGRAGTVAAAPAPAPADPPTIAAQPMQMDMPPAGWQFMQDGVLFAVYDHQGGPRGGDEIVVPNWWMGMASRTIGGTQLTLNGMFSLDPATVGKSGYREIFQVGETLNGRPLIDRQHPHDLFMQLAAIWRVPVTDQTGLTIAGGPAGEPALGPVAFMHRPSAAENPSAPLSHHTFDSTHVSFGVVTAAVDHGPFAIEASLFNGREPDENRWDFDFGRMDSVSGRLWYRPDARWELQVSTGHLKDPEVLTPGDVQRTTASASWFGRNGENFTAAAFGYGVNAAHDSTRHAVFAEATRRAGPTSIFARAEAVQVEADLLLGGAVPATSRSEIETVGALTIGAVRDLPRWRGLEGGLGAAAVFYAVPDALDATHGAHPVSFQVFFRLRPPAGPMGRMWNMRMSQPMAGHAMSHTMN